MEGVEGVISMMDDEEAEKEEDEHGGEKEGKEERGGEEANVGLQSLLLSEILQFRTSQLRRVKVGEEGGGESKNTVESESVVKSKSESKSLVENDSTLTDISLFTTDSGNEAGVGFMISDQVRQCFLAT